MLFRDEINFILNGRSVTLKDVKANQTLLDFLRLDQRLTGTKEGCAEGDCGACTVLVGRLHNGILKYEVVNACIRFLASVDGCHIVSIEYLAGPNGKLHPVQKRWLNIMAANVAFARQVLLCRYMHCGWKTHCQQNVKLKLQFRVIFVAVRATNLSLEPLFLLISLEMPHLIT